MAGVQIEGMVRQAVGGDLPRIMEIVRGAILGMQAEGSDQWSEEYPRQADFEDDIREGTLFVDVGEDGRPRGVVCLNFGEPEQYKAVEWSKNAKAVIIHRMAVGSAYRGQGVAARFMDFAEDQARKLGLNYIRSDTYSLNLRMNAIFKKWNYSPRGNIRFEGRIHDFNCWDKILT